MEETTGELSEENTQEDQMENPNPPEPEIEAEVMVNDQPIKPTEETNLNSMMKFMMEQFGQMNKKLESDKEELNKKLEKLDILNDKIESNHEDLKRSQEALEKKSEELKKQIKKDLELVNKKMENNHDILQRKIEEEGEKNREELRFMFVEFREEDKRTKTGMNKRWEETSYPVSRLQETLVSDFKPRNETLDLSLIHI